MQPAILCREKKGGGGNVTLLLALMLTPSLRPGAVLEIFQQIKLSVYGGGGSGELGLRLPLRLGEPR